MQKLEICTLDKMQKIISIDEEFRIELRFNKEEIYNWLNDQLDEVVYRKLKKKRKSIVLKFIKRVTKYSGKQVKRLIAKYKQRELSWNKEARSLIHSVYNHEDIKLLHQVDEEHRLSGQATKAIFQRELLMFGDERFRRLANISVAHIYNLRSSDVYLNYGRVFDKTKSVISNIGIRRKPQPNGQPGYFRVDTVHQGDKRKKKGVYYINVVDEVIQYEYVFCVKAISQRYLKEILEHLVVICPFKIINFHSDNGSEYINQTVAHLLNKLHIKQTKSRARKHNDNGLVESKNGSVIRKHFGYFHIPATDYNKNLINKFCLKYFNAYLNFHRPCGFPSIVTDKKGKEIRKYRQEDYKTPYEKLKPLPNAEKHLKEGIKFEDIDEVAYNLSDTEYAQRMNKAKKMMLKKLKLDL